MSQPNHCTKSSVKKGGLLGLERGETGSGGSEKRVLVTRLSISHHKTRGLRLFFSGGTAPFKRRGSRVGSRTRPSPTAAWYSVSTPHHWPPSPPPKRRQAQTPGDQEDNGIRTPCPGPPLRLSPVHCPFALCPQFQRPRLCPVNPPSHPLPKAPVPRTGAASHSPSPRPHAPGPQPCPGGAIRTLTPFFFFYYGIHSLMLGGYPPTAIGYTPTAIGYTPTAIGYPPTAIGYPPTAIGYTPMAIGYPPAAIVGRIGHSEFFFFHYGTLSHALRTRGSGPGTTATAARRGTWSPCAGPRTSRSRGPEKRRPHKWPPSGPATGRWWWTWRTAGCTREGSRCWCSTATTQAPSAAFLSAAPSGPGGAAPGEARRVGVCFVAFGRGRRLLPARARRWSGNGP